VTGGVTWDVLINPVGSWTVNDDEGRLEASCQPASAELGQLQQHRWKLG
jgi:hypothetical protein